MKKVLTLCVIHQDSRVLLGMKKRGFGEGRWNGFGGKVSDTESIEEATVREVEEEAGIHVLVSDIEKRGVLEFRFEDQPGEVLEVHIFSTTNFTGEPTESEEMRPQWFEINTIPYKEMWPDDIYWLPELLKGRCFTGSFLFGPHDAVLEHTLAFVPKI
jgi:8-oxo-dGTP diphosphatase / 2-hydroxy-dATP diphosphatase